jgi:2-hydroxychromene-2-carboxylate isomerase
VPIAVPPGKPNTGRAIAAAARALSIDSARAQAFTRSLYWLFWVDGQDLSNEALLQQEAERHGFAPALIAGRDAIGVESLLSSWETQWIETEHQGVPILERPDRALLVGLMPVQSIQEFLAGW